MLQKEFLFDKFGGKVKFQIIWNAIGFLPPNGSARNIEILRREAGISKKLRSISELKTVDEVHQTRELKGIDQKLVFNQPEIDMIRDKIEKYPYWNPLADESPADVYDWLSTGKELLDDVSDKPSRVK